MTFEQKLMNIIKKNCRINEGQLYSSTMIIKIKQAVLEEIEAAYRDHRAFHKKCVECGLPQDDLAKRFGKEEK